MLRNAGRAEHAVLNKAVQFDQQISYTNYVILDDYFNSLSQFPWQQSNHDQIYFGKCFGKNKWFITIGCVQSPDAKRCKHEDGETVWQAFDDSPAYTALLDLTVAEHLAADLRMDAACEQMGFPNFGLILDVNDDGPSPDLVVLSYHMIPVQLTRIISRKDLEIFPTVYLARSAVKN